MHTEHVSANVHLSGPMPVIVDLWGYDEGGVGQDHVCAIIADSAW